MELNEAHEIVSHYGGSGHVGGGFYAQVLAAARVLSNRVRELEGEKQCQRCKEWGQDRRVLYLSSFWQLTDLGLPFEVRDISDPPIRIYCLTICKDCRTEWHQALRGWFNYSL